MRNIPAALQAHKNGEATTLCKLIKMTAKDGTIIGMTTLDIDVLYNDGFGMLRYHAPVGCQPASIYQANGFEVNNSEFQALVVPEYNLPLDEFDVNSGRYDYADFIMYEVNYEDLTMGHWIVMSGQMGRMRSQDGIQIFGEMRSIKDLFRRTVVELDSISCRAKFGSTSATEKFPCGFDAESLWLTGTVGTVDVDNTRVFTDPTRLEPDGFFYPGLLQFLTGDNAGKYIEVETFQTGGIITLAYNTSYVIKPGDTYRIRRECSRIARDAAKGCKHWFGSSWGLHFRGEPDIPIGDIGTLTTPNIGGNETVTSDEEPEE